MGVCARLPSFLFLRSLPVVICWQNAANSSSVPSRVRHVETTCNLHTHTLCLAFQSLSHTHIIRNCRDAQLSLTEVPGQRNHTWPWSVDSAIRLRSYECSVPRESSPFFAHFHFQIHESVM